MGWLEITEKGRYGDKVVRIFIPDKTTRISRGPVIILMHGVHGCANVEVGNKYGEIAQLLLNEGINATMIETSRAHRDMTPYGDDRTSWALEAFKGKTFGQDHADNIVGVSRIQKEFPNSDHWLWGFSLGGIHAILIASENIHEKPQGLILSGSGINVTKEAEDALKLPILDTMPPQKALEEAAMKISTKKLISFWGTEDNVFSKESCKAIVDLVPLSPGNKEFHVIEGADHSFRLMRGKQSIEPIKAMLDIVAPHVLQGQGTEKPI